MAMSLHQDLLGSFRKDQPCSMVRFRGQVRLQKLLKRLAGSRDYFRPVPQLAAQQRRVIILDRQDAAWFASDNGVCRGRHPGVETIDIAAGMIDSAG